MSVKLSIGATRYKLYAGLASGVVLLWIGSKWLFSTVEIPPHPCDTLASPGHLRVNLTSPLHTYWKPLDEETCPSLPDYLPTLWHLSHGPHRPLPQYASSVYSQEYQTVAAQPVPLRYERFFNLLSTVGASGRKLKSGKGHDGSKSTSSSSSSGSGGGGGGKKGGGKAIDLGYKVLADPLYFLRPRRSHVPTILILGDSVDRNGLVHFCQLMKGNLTLSHYHDITQHPPVPPTGDLTKSHGPQFDGWDQRGLPHLCEIPFYSSAAKTKDASMGTSSLALRIVNGFHYGMDALDEFDTPDHTDWHRPGRIEVRIDELVVPMVEQLGGTDKIDLISLHSGMWDLALFGLQDDKTKWSLTVPLTPEQLAWWQERMRKTIAHVRETFPKARLVFRKLHRTDDLVAGTQYITNLRVHQLRHLQEEVARSEGVPTFDFGHMLEGYQLFQEKVHPLLVPGGIMYAQNLIHQLRIAFEDPESWRKGWFA